MKKPMYGIITCIVCRGVLYITKDCVQEGDSIDADGVFPVYGSKAPVSGEPITCQKCGDVFVSADFISKKKWEDLMKERREVL